MDQGVVLGGRLTDAVVGKLRIDEFPRDPAELARRRGHLAPGARLRAAAELLGFEDLDHLAAVQPDLDHVADVAEFAPHPGGHLVADDLGQPVVAFLQVSAPRPR